MTIDCILMISIFQQAFPLDPEGDVEDYIALFAPEIDRLGRVLKFLGLAERAPKSRIMWKPTLQLLTLIGQKLTQPSVKLKCTVTDGDREFVQAFILRATGDTRPTPLKRPLSFAAPYWPPLAFCNKMRPAATSQLIDCTPSCWIVSCSHSRSTQFGHNGDKWASRPHPN